ncbi:hypothetical protein [Streptacidiphilus sp. MAP5-3]|uniref:hypothetical protein n=1 Tax=unclassified Streptacidiphilus TaxID=2643834 RepID=UPI0035165F98
MAGYANRTILLDFPELSEDGDKVHVIIRNPKMMPVQDLNPPDFPLQEGETETERDFRQGLVVLARLVVAWHVYDATDLNEDQALLPLPATPELVAKLPVEIQTTMGEAIKAVRNPG